MAYSKQDPTLMGPVGGKIQRWRVLIATKPKMDGSTSSNTQLKWVLLSTGPKAILGPAGGSFGSSFHKDPMMLGPAGFIRVGSYPQQDLNKLL